MWVSHMLVVKVTSISSSALTCTMTLLYACKTTGSLFPEN